MNENITLIKTKLVETASYFLESMGMFYPFGLALLPDGNINLYGVEEQDKIEFIDSDTLINRISNKLFQSIDDNSALTIGIAINTVFSKSDNQDINCIEIRVLDSSNQEFQTYIKYDILDEELMLYAENPHPWL